MDQRIKALFTQPFRHFNRRLDKHGWSWSVGNHVPHDVIDPFSLSELSTSHEYNLLHRAAGRHAIHDLP